jgi:hypothetical protein
LEEIYEEFGDVLDYIELRWLSRNSVLSRFFNLRAEIEIFIKKGANQCPNYQVQNVFANELNRKLQGKEKFLACLLLGSAVL